MTHRSLRYVLQALAYLLYVGTTFCCFDRCKAQISEAKKRNGGNLDYCCARKRSASVLSATAPTSSSLPANSSSVAVVAGIVDPKTDKEPKGAADKAKAASLMGVMCEGATEFNDITAGVLLIGAYIIVVSVVLRANY